MNATTIENETDAARESRAATSSRCTVSRLQDGQRRAWRISVIYPLRELS